MTSEISLLLLFLSLSSLVLSPFPPLSAVVAAAVAVAVGEAFCSCHTIADITTTTASLAEAVLVVEEDSPAAVFPEAAAALAAAAVLGDFSQDKIVPMQHPAILIAGCFAVYLVLY